MSHLRSHSSRQTRTWILVATVTATLSAVVPLTFDEAIWVWAGRRMLAGGVPYQEVVDHKTVLVFALEGLLDIAPGSFEVARGLAVGITIAAIAAMASGVFRRMGGDHRLALKIGLLSAAVAFLQTRLVSTVELWAAATLLGGLFAVTGRRYRLAALMTCIGAFIDVRTVILAPVVALFVLEQSGRLALRKFASVLAPLLLIAITAVLALPDLRFGIVELTMATRSTQFYPFEQTMVGIRAVILPAVILPIIIQIRPSVSRPALHKSGVLLLCGAVAIAIGSRLPFHRYWLFTALSIPLIAGHLQTDSDANRRDRPPRTVIALLVGLALLPGTLRIGAETFGVGRQPLAAYRPVISALELGLAPGQSFILYPDKPYLAAYLPNRIAAPSVVMHYYASATSRKELALSQLQASIDAAAVVVDEGQLRHRRPGMSSGEQEVWEIFSANMSKFPCRQVLGTITLHWRDAACSRSRAS